MNFELCDRPPPSKKNDDITEWETLKNLTAPQSLIGLKKTYNILGYL